MYWIVTLALFALSYLPGIARAGPPDVDLLLRSMFFLSWTKGNEVYPILNVGWSLEYEVLFYIIATAGMALAKRPWGITAFIMLALVTSGRGTSFFLQNPIIVEFVLGMTIATALIDRPSFLPMLAGTALVIATLALAPTVQVWRLWMFGLPSAVVVAGAVMLDNRRSYAGRILPELGNASYSIYLTHVVVISLACKLMVKLAPATPLPVAIAAISILSVAAGYVVYRVLELRLTSLISRRPLREVSPVHQMPGSNT
ncbi:hypothetical protein ASE75_14790 [Sphingomonas sp. Leaf17]|nr:hypothetical protein ASE75_14790 [Sphingomonas sp. Leaf17]